MDNDIKFDFDKNIKYLLETNLSTAIKNNIINQDKILNSKDFNTTFDSIQNSLEFLYEKNRVLEDVIRYSNLYLKNEINNSITECKTLLASIEEDRDMTKNNSYIKYSVPFISGANNYIDRDNTGISGSVLYEDKLTLANTNINDYSPIAINIVKTAENNNIFDTSGELINNNAYRTFYMFDSPQGNDISETLTLILDKPSKINKINFGISNCIIDDISFILEDDSTYSIGTHIGLFKTLIVKQVIIKIKSKNYIMSQIDYKKYNETNDDFWGAIDELKADENLILDTKKYYYYLFGIDNLLIELTSIENQSCFYSKEIKIDNLSINEHITIDTIDSIGRGSIEYYIVDGTNIISILPEKITKVIDEKIFYKMSLRFAYDITKPIIIKRNGDIIKMTIQEAINKNEKDITYTVSYTPINTNINSLNNSKIKIKTIIRSYDENFNSFITSINIKKYGGGKLWIDKI